MAFIPKANTGTLWPNDKKKTETHPDVRGDLHLDRDFIKAMMMKHPEGLIKISVAGWKKEINGKECVSMKASEPYVKPQAPIVPDEDVPF